MLVSELRWLMDKTEGLLSLSFNIIQIISSFSVMAKFECLDMPATDKAVTTAMPL